MNKKPTNAAVQATLAAIRKYNAARTALYDAKKQLRTALLTVEQLDDTKVHSAILHFRNNPP